ncbi:metallophosphoesterase [Nanoarchaeota archaeon]
MKILAAGDIHGDIGLARKLAQVADDNKVDLVILCGDVTFAEQNTDNLLGPFVEKNKKVLVVPGNHETEATVATWADMYYENVKNLHGYSVKYDDVGIFGAGGANIGLHQLSEGELFDLLKKGHEKVNYLKKKIMVTHVHPSESKMEKFSDIVKGSSGIRKAISEFKPTVLLCSHVHEAEGLQEMIDGSLVINVGKRGKIIDI